MNWRRLRVKLFYPGGMVGILYRWILDGCEFLYAALQQLYYVWGMKTY